MNKLMTINNLKLERNDKALVREQGLISVRAFLKKQNHNILKNSEEYRSL